jgi:hypothetical protein
MNRCTLILIVVVWVLLTLYNYFYMNFFFLALLWMGLSLLLLVVALIQIIKLVRERHSISSLRVQKVVVFTVLFLLTYYHSFTNSIIEKADWKLFYKQRFKVVEMAKSGQLKPNVSWNGVVCELPFEFPVISNGGNDIVISKNEENGRTTVKFWIFRNFFDSPSTYFIYTDDSTRIAYVETKI